MNKNKYFPLTPLSGNIGNGAIFGIGDRTLCAGSWHIKVYDTLTQQQLKDAFLEIYPATDTAPARAILKGKGLRKRGIHLKRARYKDRFMFRTTHINVLFRVPYKELATDHPSMCSGMRYCYPAVIETTHGPTGINFYMKEPLKDPASFDFQAYRNAHMVGEHKRYCYVDSVETKEEAIAWLKTWKRKGGDIGAIQYDDTQEVTEIRCEHMYVDMEGSVVCGMALGKRGRGGAYMDGCIIDRYTPPEYCPELDENKENQKKEKEGVM